MLWQKLRPGCADVLACTQLPRRGRQETVRSAVLAWPTVRIQHGSRWSTSVNRFRTGFPQGALGLSESAEEILDASDHHQPGADRRPSDLRSELGGRTLHLHALLTAASRREDPGHLCLLSRRGRCVGDRRRHRCRSARGALHPAQARCKHAGERDAFLSGTGRARPKSSTSWCSTTSRSSSSNDCSRPISHLRRGVSAHSGRAAGLDQGEALPERPARQGAQGEPGKWRCLARSSAVLRTPPEPCRERVLPVPVRARGGADDGRGWRVDDDFARLGRATISR